MEIKKTPDRNILCTAVEKIAGKARPINLLIPVSAYTRIQSQCVQQPFGEDVVQRLFETWIRQRVEFGALADLSDGVLLEGEVDGLFSDIRAVQRRQMGGWTKPGAGIQARRVR